MSILINNYICILKNNVPLYYGKKCFYLFIFAALYTLQSIAAQAQDTVRNLELAIDPQNVATSSTTELDTVAAYHDDAYVEDYLYQRTFHSGTWQLIRSRSAITTNLPNEYMNARIHKGSGNSGFLPAPESGSIAQSGPPYDQLVQPTITISPIQPILIDNSVKVNISVQNLGEGESATLTLSAVSGSGRAHFVANDSTKLVINTNGNYSIEIKGVTASDSVNNMILRGQINEVIKSVNFTVFTLLLNEVAYSGNRKVSFMTDTLRLYRAPHWKDNSIPANGTADDPGDINIPVAFIRNSTMNISAKWVIAPAVQLSNISIKIRGMSIDTDNSNNLIVNIPETNAVISDNILSISNIATSTVLPNTVAVLPYYTNWQATYDQSWSDIGWSSNKVYVTFAENQTVTPAQTMLDIACEFAYGLSNQEQIVQGIYLAFMNKSITRHLYDANLNELPDQQPLTFYKSHHQDKLAADADTLLSSTLSNGDGSTTAWVELLQKTLLSVGVSLQMETINITAENQMPLGPPLQNQPPIEVGFFFKYWNYTNNPSNLFPDYPYLNSKSYQNGDANARPWELDSSYTFDNADATYGNNGIGGQGVPNPGSMFSFYQVLMIEFPSLNSVLCFDPAHGAYHESKEHFLYWGADAGYLLYNLQNVNEAVFGHDLNGDGEAQNNVSAYVFFLQANPNISIFKFGAPVRFQ